MIRYYIRPIPNYPTNWRREFRFPGYARWDGKCNDLDTKMAYNLFRIKLNGDGFFVVQLRPLVQYPFGFYWHTGYEMKMREIRMFWISIVWHVESKRAKHND